MDDLLHADPESSHALFRKSKSLYMKNEPEEALACLNKALNIDPSN